MSNNLYRLFSISYNDKIQEDIEDKTKGLVILENIEYLPTEVKALIFNIAENGIEKNNIYLVIDCNENRRKINSI